MSEWDDVEKLSIASREAQKRFASICAEVVPADADARDAHRLRFEQAKAEMQEAMRVHHAACGNFS